MFEIIGYWVCTTLLVTPIWVIGFLFLYLYMDEVYYRVPDNRTHLPFYDNLNSLANSEKWIGTAIILGVISAVFTIFSGLIGLKEKMGFMEGIINFSHKLSTFLSIPTSWVITSVIVLFAIRTAVQFAAKFAVLRKKIDELNK